jgi:4-amino-4-deoxy-L-arabinose transferase-like glycosyltransferase
MAGAISRGLAGPPAILPALGRRLRQHWPLWLVLALQAGVTAYGIGAHGIFTDEALYLRAGTDEWAHWLHGAVIPQQYSRFFSGAYFLWPALGGIGYNAGGVVGARIITMLLTLGSTGLVYLGGLRLRGQVLAGFAAGFAGLTGLLGYAGASATFEPLAIFFLTLAVYLIIRADGRWPWLAAAGVAAGMANGAKFATIAWDPVILGVAFFCHWENWTAALRRAAVTLASLLAADTALAVAGGASLMHALFTTTITRPHPPSGLQSPAGAIFTRSLALTGVALAMAVLAIIASLLTREHFSQTCLIGLMTVSLLIVPIDQARLYQAASLDRNLSLGVSIGALAAAYGACYASEFLERHMQSNQYALRALFVLPIAIMLAISFGFQWQGTSTRETKIAAYIRHSYVPGTFIAALHGGAVNVLRLELPEVPRKAWVYTGEHRYPSLVARHRVSLVILDYWARNPAAEASMIRLLQQSSGWVLLRQFGHGQHAQQLWRYKYPHPVQRLLTQ